MRHLKRALLLFLLWWALWLSLSDRAAQPLDGGYVDFVYQQF
ncbi:hypothetical protein [Chitinimonas koreensis]|nr:hypothetical protein [Chitinimonas koreensis]